MPSAAVGKKPGPRPILRTSHEIRIVGGAWKRTRIAVPDQPGLRPTPDRVRETLFNWLGQDLEGWRCADVFAGTGALGFECASRGAARTTLLEQDAGLVVRMRALRERLNAGDSLLDIRRGDGIAWLRQQPAGSLELVLLDPPFDAGLWTSALQAATPALAPGGYLYLEAPQPWDAPTFAAQGLGLARTLKAGNVHAHLARKVDPALP